MEHAGKTALVTGAAGAIGLATTAALAKQGAHVFMIDRDAEALAGATQELGAAVTPITLDLDDPEATVDALDRIVARRRIDILVNNAGILTNTKLAGTTLDQWQQVQRINLQAALLMSQRVVDGMSAAGWGRIINVTSYAAKCGGLTAGTAYTVSKSAMIGLTFSVAKEFADKGITVNAVAPAYVMSPMVAEKLTDRQRAELLKLIPVCRFCDPAEVAHAIAFLASPKAGFITGEVLDMNGGLQFD